MRKPLTFCASITLAIVLGFGPLLTLAAPVDKRVSDSSRVVARTFTANSEASKSAKPLFSSKLLFKRPPQNESAAPGQSTTLLPDGRALKIGGLEDDGPVSIASIEGSRIHLQIARAWHTATMLPDGKVLIVGGMGIDGQPVDKAEILDPETQTSEILTGPLQSSTINPQRSITPRVYHTATLLTEGLVLISGGVSGKADALRTAQLWDFRTKVATTLRSKLKTARYNHAATLLANGNVLLSGGTDKGGANIENDELYDPQSQRFTKAKPGADNDPQASILNPRLSASLPEDGATNVPLDAFIAFRFSKVLRVKTVNSDSVTLNGPYGRVKIKVVPAEGGMLAFITPESPLFPGAAYTVSLSGLTDTSNDSLADSSISFSTAQAPAPIQGFDDEEWRPDTRSGQGDWQSGRSASAWQSLPPLQAPLGVTALAGQVLALNGKPIANVTLKIGDKTTETDNTGRFLLAYLSQGHHELLMDGRTASKGAKTYGVFEAGIKIEESMTNVLPYTIWMPRLDTAHIAMIPSPTTTEVVVTTPHIPGLEVHIPPNTVIYDKDKNPVTQLSITPIPIDRTPFPLPAGVYVPIYFTIQPGSGYVKTLAAGGPKGARIIYPNYRDQSPATRHNFWHYDPEEKGWYVYGQGTVTEDGKQVVPDPGVAVYEFTGAMISPNGNPPPDWPPPGSCSVDGDPVDLSTGLFLLNNTDMFLPDVLPISLTRTYRPKDTASRPFGIGSTHPYEMFLWSVTNYTQADLILPDGGRIHYVRISSGNNYFDAEYEHTATPTAFYKSRLKWNGTGWDLTLKNGTVYVFGDVTPLQSIRDRYGNKILITRANGQSGNITRITSSNGRWMEFSYDGSNRITQARDLIGRAVNYTYDASGRLWKVTDPMSGVTEYTYDSSHRMLTIKNPRGIVYVTNEYDANGRISRQTHADGGLYQFAYTLDGNGKVIQANVTDPRGNHRIATFNSNGYLLTDTQTTCCSGSSTIERQSETNMITSVTDQAGHRTEFVRNAMGSVTSVTRLAGTSEAVTQTFTYDPTFNRLASVTDPLGHSVSLAYDGNGSLTSTTDQLGNQYTVTYNPAGQATSLTDPLNHISQFAYDSGDLFQASNPLGNAITVFMDSAGRHIALTDPLGRAVRSEYDALDRPTRVTDQLQGATQYAYDANSNLLNMTDPRGGVTSFAYDNMDRLVTRTDPLLRLESYQYDANGNLTQVTDRKGQVTTYSYDAMNRLTLVQYGDLATTTYSYDAADRLTQVVDSVSGTIAYTYDNLDRVSSETTPQGTVTYTYDGANRRTSMTAAGQPTISYGYDNANRLTQITQGTANITLAYDAGGRRTSTTLSNGVVTQYSYDSASRMIGITYTKGGVTLGSLIYSYDGAGIRTAVGGSFAQTGLPQAVTGTNYNAANGQMVFGSQSLIYDNNGNLTSDGINTYAWNARDQLVSISGPGVTASFQYDAFGRRVVKSLNGTVTNFLYDDEDAIQEQVGGVPTANSLVGGLDEVFTRTGSSGTWRPLTDALGSTIALTDSSGTIQTQYTYEPFGKTTSSGSSSTNSVQFTGRENDGTGLYYYRSRYYSPSLQRFISEDPIGFGAGVNFYSYVLNNPASLIDPFGLKPRPGSSRERECSPTERISCDGFCAAQGKTVQRCKVSQVFRVTRWKGLTKYEWADSTGWQGPAPMGCYCNEGPLPCPCPEGFRHPTKEEDRLREESHRRMAEVWKWVLVGDAALLLVGTGGAFGIFGGGGAAAAAGARAPSGAGAGGLRPAPVHP